MSRYGGAARAGRASKRRALWRARQAAPRIGAALIGHVSTSVTETAYRHEVRPALTKGATAMDKILKKSKTA